MPHLIVEYSANVEDRIDLDGLLDRLHTAAAGYEVFPLGELRVRAERREHYRVADGHPDNGFVHVTAIIGHGRSLEVRKEVGQGLFDVICELLHAPFKDSPLAISFNIREFHPELNYKRNNLHEYVRARTDSNSDPMVGGQTLDVSR